MTTPRDPIVPVLKPELLALLEEGRGIEVVALADPYFKAAVWYGEWAIRVPGRPGEGALHLATARGRPPRSPRVFKTINGLVSVLQELGIETAGIPMRKDRAVALSAGPAPSVEARDDRHGRPGGRTTDAPDDLSADLLTLTRHGFVAVPGALRLIASEFAGPVHLGILRDEGPLEMQVLRLTTAGAAAARALEAVARIEPGNTDDIPGWARAVTVAHIRDQAAAGLYADRIACARIWYRGDALPERQRIDQPPVRLSISERRRRRA